MSLRREFAKPSFDEIQPRRAGRREVQDKARMHGQPRGDIRMRVGPVIIQNQMQRQVPRELAVEPPQKPQEFVVGIAPPLFQRQPRLGAVERLNLALLVDTQDDGFVGRVEVEAHDIRELLHES